MPIPKNLTGETPLDIALKREDNKTAELLRDHGAVSGTELKDDTGDED